MSFASLCNDGMRTAMLATLAGIVFPLVGCGGDSSGRLAVSGEVTLDGSPLSDAAIQFLPLDAQKSSSGATVMAGQFKIPAEKGLLPGRYRVVLTAPDENAPPVVIRDSPGGPSMSGAPERIPSEYNVNSQQTVEVSEDGENHFEYHIVGRPRK